MSRDGEVIDDQHFAKGRGSEPATVWGDRGLHGLMLFPIPGPWITQ